MSTALILSGAVAKGAFEAGVLAYLAETPLRITRIVSTSAGSLNGAVYAAGIRHNAALAAARVLKSLWLEHGRWADVLRLSPGGLLHLQGLSSLGPIIDLVKEALERVSSAGGEAPKPSVVLQMITTRLNGALRQRGDVTSTTFEHVLDFSEHDLDDAERRLAIARGAAASAAFPFLFEPLELDALGPCADGGAVNNTPISYALESPDVERVIAVTGNPLRAPVPESLRGTDLLGQTVDIVINERLFRDLTQAQQVNAKLAKVVAALDASAADADTRRRVLDALGWRKLEIIEIRPEEQLEGNSFSALGDRDLREKYIEIGWRCAERRLRAR